MNVTRIKQVMRRLSLEQLRRLEAWLQEFIKNAEDAAPAVYPPSRKQVVEERTIDNITYCLEGVRCGKENCKCARGKLHGPYWYSYTRIEGKVKSKYIGKKLPPEVEKRKRLQN